MGFSSKQVQTLTEIWKAIFDTEIIKIKINKEKKNTSSKPLTQILASHFPCFLSFSLHFSLIMHISLLLQGLPRHGTVTTKKIEKNLSLLNKRIPIFVALSNIYHKAFLPNS